MKNYVLVFVLGCTSCGSSADSSSSVSTASTFSIAGEFNGTLSFTSGASSCEATQSVTNLLIAQAGASMNAGGAPAFSDGRTWITWTATETSAANGCAGAFSVASAITCDDSGCNMEISEGIGSACTDATTDVATEVCNYAGSVTHTP